MKCARVVEIILMIRVKVLKSLTEFKPKCVTLVSEQLDKWS